MKHLLAIALLVVLTLVVWLDSCYRWSTLISPTFHHRCFGISLSSGYISFHMLPGRPHGWGWQRHPPTGPALMNVQQIAGFGWKRSPKGDYLIFPIWFVALIWSSVAFYFWGRSIRPKRQIGFPVDVTRPEISTPPVLAEGRPRRQNLNRR